MSIEIPAIVEKVIFPNKKKGHANKDGFAIFSVSLNAVSSKYTPQLEDEIQKKLKGKNSYYDTFCITIDMYKTNEKYVGGQYIFIGEYATHPKFGPQFKSEFFYEDDPTTSAEGLKAFLMKLPNIKQVRSRAIMDKFGYEETVRILEEEPLKLVQISGITERMIEDIKKKWDESKGLRRLYDFLNQYKIPFGIGSKAYDKWEDDAIEVIKENPYRLTELPRIGFLDADMYAHSIFEGKIPIPYRTKACLYYVLKEDIRSNSNLCMPYKTLRIEMAKLLKSSDERMSRTSDVDAHVNHINTCLRNNMDTFTAIKDTKARQGDISTFVYLKSIWDKELFITEELYKRNCIEEAKAQCSDVDIIDAEDDIKRFTGKKISLDKTQKDAIKSSFEKHVTVITGGGGTGKSTICRCIYYLAQKKRLSVRMMSPTGKAAQVLSEKTRCTARTIHRSLKFTPDCEYPNEMITEDIIVIDEVSMVGIDTMFSVFYAMTTNPKANIVFVGDCNQLPSVSPGNFLFDIMQNQLANIIRLDIIHRQDENSYISILANDISHGKIVEVPKEASDIRWNEIVPEHFSMKLSSVISSFLTKHDMSELQVMSPKYKGECGVDKCNDVIQQMMANLNGNMDTFLETKFKKFYKGDRVIQTENNYEKMIFNGDMGLVVDLGTKVIDPQKSDKEDRFIIVDFYGDEKVFVGDEIESLNLAWCITVHKFQGSQSPYILFVMSDEASYMMSKELVYTAFTRAEKFLDIYGSTRMLTKAPMKSVIKKRFTNMGKIVRDLRSGESAIKVLKGNTENT